jgi:hypothetical protein
LRDLTVALGRNAFDPEKPGAIDGTQTIEPWMLENVNHTTLHLTNGDGARTSEEPISNSSTSNATLSAPNPSNEFEHPVVEFEPSPSESPTSFLECFTGEPDVDSTLGKHHLDNVYLDALDKSSSANTSDESTSEPDLRLEIESITSIDSESQDIAPTLVRFEGKGPTPTKNDTDICASISASPTSHHDAYAVSETLTVYTQTPDTFPPPDLNDIYIRYQCTTPTTDAASINKFMPERKVAAVGIPHTEQPGRITPCMYTCKQCSLSFITHGQLKYVATRSRVPTLTNLA